LKAGFNYRKSKFHAEESAGGQSGRLLLDRLIGLPLRCMMEFDPGEDRTKIMRLLHARDTGRSRGLPEVALAVGVK